MIKKILKENIYYLTFLIILILISAFIMKTNIYNYVISFDNLIIKFNSNLLNTYLTLLFHIITYFGDFYIPILIIMCILLFIKNKWYFYTLTSGYLFSGIIVYLSKLLIGRPRPLNALINIPKSFSFPSGHTLTSLVFYYLLCYLLTINKSKKTKIISYIITSILVFLIASSRIYLGVHYFSDVIGGIIIGIICILLIINIIEKNFKEKLK